ncbi:imidazole glycerol phosphate synthase subunit HisH [Salinirarus marinus]|uniref:imidazole glycerol phosphate synthase subunit HisH n=1 Tax=Salinirarus marinus TaxID=3068310 RepID=UPI003C6C5B7A
MSLSEPPSETLADVLIVDYGLGNLRSARRGLERAGAAVTVTDDPDDFAAADGIVLPGVGAFREGMENAGPYRDALADAVDRGQPVFGICLGMQMLLTTSEEADHAGEGEVEGLDFIPGRNVRFDEGRKVPHMGWNELSVKRDHPLVEGVDGDASSTHRADGTAPRGGSVDGEYAYFVHSYYARPDAESAVVATTDYGVEFPAVVANDAGNVFGTQFHPEKSGETGLRILRNFVEFCAEG